jgi:hypothetical protein
VYKQDVFIETGTLLPAAISKMFRWKPTSAEQPYPGETKNQITVTQVLKGLFKP